MSKLFLVFGIPKSGTTFLQRMLNMHPEISCPSEQSFNVLTSGLSTLLAQYERVLRQVDRRTGGQGIPDFDAQLRNNVLSALITALAESFAGAKPIYGLNDNSIINKVAYYEQILRRPKMIGLFRNPVDAAVSTWRHNHRLAEAEPDKADKYLGLVRNPAGTLDGYLPQFAAHYKKAASAYLAYAAKRPNFLTLRYEDLVADKKNQLKRLFRFLGADASPEIVSRIVAGSSREAMASASSNPAFFGVGNAPDDQLRVSDEVVRRTTESLNVELTRLGYNIGP